EREARAAEPGRHRQRRPPPRVLDRAGRPGLGPPAGDRTYTHRGEGEQHDDPEQSQTRERTAVAPEPASDDLALGEPFDVLGLDRVLDRDARGRWRVQRCAHASNLIRGSTTA